MTFTLSGAGLAFGATLVLAGTAMAGDKDYDALVREVEMLRSRVAQLEQSESAPLDEARANENRALVSDVLADADQRASLQSSGMTAGWDKGFFLASPDGNFKLNVSGYGQIQYIYNRLGGSQPGEDRNAKGFQIRRGVVAFSGHIVDPSWQYKINGDFAADGGDFILEDAYLLKTFDNGLFAIAGQLKVPMLRETLVDDTVLLSVDRSLVESEFGAGRTQGVAAGWSNDFLKLVFAYTDGHPATGGYNQPWNTTTTEWSFTGRGDIKFAGDWSQWNSLTSFQGDAFSAFLGGAFHYQKGEFGTTTPDELEVFQATVDGSIGFGGANLYGAFIYRGIEGNATPIDQDALAVVVQGGIFVLPKLELFGRFEWSDPDQAGSDDLALLTAGVNWYFAKQTVKWTFELGYSFNEISAYYGNGFLGTGGPAAGWRTDIDDGQFAIRSQLQFVF